MAGRKITQLPTLTTPEATDKLVIVDVSDTSESPQGTSKQIAVENLGISGTFTPVASDVTGSVNIEGGCYSRSGQVVTMSFRFGAEAEAGTPDISFDFTLPVASAFTNARQLFGSNSSNPDLTYCLFQSNGDKGSIEISTQDVDQTIQNISVTVQYFIL
jgi:hypothetical protein